MRLVARRLAELGVTLPQPITPIANYVPFARTGNLLFLSGQLCLVDGAPVAKGKLGAEVSIEQGQAAARTCAINLLAQVSVALGDLDKVVRVVRLGGFISATPDFLGASTVMNGALDFMVAVFGDCGRHARSAVAVPCFPPMRRSKSKLPSKCPDRSVTMSDQSQLAQQPVATTASKWDYCSVTQLAEALRARKVSALELVNQTIARILRLDPRINALVVRDFERARLAAVAADGHLAHGKHGPLLGIPITIKEAFNVGGLPTTWGFPPFKSFIPQDDAVVVSRLKNAGAVLLGKTNVPMGLGDFQSYNGIYGTTNNPWDVGRSPGGSSGGSAAALAAGFGALSVGSDIGGSLRVPAHFCGIYAHKPTLGLVPFRGYGPPPSPPLPRGNDIAVIGPMATTAADLALALNVIAGLDEERGGIAYRLALPPARHGNLRDFRVLVIDCHPLMPIDNAVRTAIARLSDWLAKAGVRIAHSSALLPDLAASARLYMGLLASSKAAGLPPEQYQAAQHQAAILASDDNSLAATRTRGAVMSHRDWIAADVARAQLQQQWRLLFQDYDVVLYPAAATPAFPHDHSLPIEARHLEIDGKAYGFLDACFVWADPATTCGLPSTAAPIDRSPGGLPIGVQIIGPYLEDHTTITFAALLEREFGGFVPPPGYAD
jgi:amidase